MDYQALEEHMMARYRSELSHDLHYHGIEHITDVIKATDMLAQHAHVNGRELVLLKTGALLHDCGFLRTYANHEEMGCEIAKEVLPDFGYSTADIEVICGLIMATKVPQKPQTKLEEILCDADLDYLGRDDYDAISGKLYKELSERDIINSEAQWQNIQISFLTGHHYFTNYSVQNREPVKQTKLKEIKESVDDQ